MYGRLPALAAVLALWTTSAFAKDDVEIHFYTDQDCPENSVLISHEFDVDSRTIYMEGTSYRYDLDKSDSVDLPITDDSSLDRVPGGIGMKLAARQPPISRTKLPDKLYDAYFNWTSFEVKMGSVFYFQWNDGVVPDLGDTFDSFEAQGHTFAPAVAAMISTVNPREGFTCFNVGTAINMNTGALYKKVNMS